MTHAPGSSLPPTRPAAAKHAQSTQIAVLAKTDHANFYLSIRDNGVGGADANRGSGLIGLADRVNAVGGQLKITSQAGSGTSLDVAIPLRAATKNTGGRPSNLRESQPDKEE